MPGATPSRVTLLTDFGTRDGYVAAMRGVIAAISAETLVDDAAHDIPPGDIVAGAFALERYWRLYPPGTVHVVVVDPGVGTDRRPLAVLAAGRILVAPDNGVLTLALQAAADAAAFEIRAPAFLHAPVSRTFHGRDVFASAAAHLSTRVSPEAVGPPVHDPVRLELPAARAEGDGVTGEVLIEDRFGNLVTNIAGRDVAPDAYVEVAGHTAVPVRGTYGAAEPGAVLALVGSSGRLEIAVRDGSAADRLGTGRGTVVRLRRTRS